MKVLVTGCAGFIGSHLCEDLLAKNYEVIGLDSLSSFYDKSIKLKNMSSFFDHSRFSFLKIDITDKAKLFSELKDRVDVVLHLAAKAGVRPSIENPADYVYVNLNGTQNILEWMLRVGCNKLFYASSSSIYGNNPEFRSLEEEGNNDRPISPYAFSKRSAEILNYTYHHLHGINVFNARFFTVFGPRQRPDLAIYKFTEQIVNNQSIVLYGDGTSARDYTYVSDIVDGILKSISYLNNNSEVFETVNFGSGRPIVLKDLVDSLYRLLERPKNIDFKELKAGDVDFTFANIDRAKRLIDYQVNTDFQNGLIQFIDWYRAEK